STGARSREDWRPPTRLALIVASVRAFPLVGGPPQLAVRALFFRDEARVAAHPNACCQRPIAHSDLGTPLNPSTIERRRDNSNRYHSLPRAFRSQVACRTAPRLSREFLHGGRPN